MPVGCPLCGKPLSKEAIQQLKSPLSLCPHCQGPIERAALIRVPTGLEKVVPREEEAPRATASKAKKFSLEVLDGNEPGRIYPIEKTRITIGRKNCDVVLTDPEISRQHAALTIDGDDAILEDLQSANGTFLAGQRIDRAPLRHGDSFRLGTHQLVLLATG